MMTRFYRFASFLALSSVAVPIAAQPRVAAFESSAGPEASRPFMFSGATVRLPLGRAEHKPDLALRMAGGVQSSGLTPRIGDGIALSVTSDNKAKLALAGQDSKLVSDRLRMSDGAKAALIVGGVIVVGGIIAIAAIGIGDSAAAAFED